MAVRLVRAAWPALLAAALAVAMIWPLVLHLGSDIPQDLADPLFSVWQGAWIGHALLEQPGELFQANRFWPERDTLAFTDVMLGYAPLYLVSAQGETAALVVYNLLFLFAYALAFFGAYLLARELGASPLAAVVGGAAFAYAPYRLAQDGHPYVISSGGIPLALFLLARGYRRRSGPLVLAGWLVTAWQLTLGFTLGVPLTYLVLAVGAVAAGYWLRRGRPRLGRTVVASTVAGLVVVAATGYLQARPYFRVADTHAEAERSPELVAFFSPPVRGLLAASEDSLLWAEPTDRVWSSLTVPGEQALFPGIAILVLAGLGLLGGTYPRALRAWLLTGTLACAVLSLGLREDGHPAAPFMPYRLLYELAPGWDAFRTPGRVHTLTSLGLALLAAAGADLVLRQVRSRPLLRGPVRRPGQRGVAAVVAGAVLTGLVLLEGLGPTRHPRVPKERPGQAQAADPRLHLPSEDAIDNRYAYWTIPDFERIVNGGGSITPARLTRIRRLAASFPDERSVAALRDLGVRTVVLHPDLATGTRWEQVAERPTAGLPLMREDAGGVVLYHLRPRSP